MRPRSVLVAIALLALVAGAPAANAKTKAKAKAKPKPKPKPVCMLLTDKAGDGSFLAAPVNSPTLDIVSGDMATGAKTIVAVLRLTSADFAHDYMSHLGFNWYIAATSTTGHSFAFDADLDPAGGWTIRAKVDSAQLPAAATAFKIDGNSLVWTVQRSASPELTRPKLVLRLFRAGSEVESATADSTDVAKTTYTDRQPSCVPAS